MLMTMMMIITIIITMIINIKSDTKQYEGDLLLFSLISFARCSSFNSGCLQASTRQFTQLGLLLSRSNSSPAAADLPLFLTSLLTRSQNQLEIHLRYYKLIIVFHVLLHKKQENTTKRHDSDTKIRISISIICVQIKKHQGQHRDKQHQHQDCQEPFPHQQSWTYLIKIHDIASFEYQDTIF